MKRNLAHLCKEPYDLIIVGGGITGACTAWDAATRGLKTALLEMGDFSHGTSSATSKLIHGGLRYLRNLELGLVRESLRERRTLSKIAPHMVAPMPFFMPAYGIGMSGMSGLSAAMVMYGTLSIDRNKKAAPDQMLPGFKWFSQESALTKEPGLLAKGLCGAFQYYDCQMHSPERFTLEFLRGAVEKGADIANYAEVTGLIIENKRVCGVEVTDHLTGEKLQVVGRVTINAAGPWANRLETFLGHEPKMDLVRSKGIHLVTRKFHGDHALVLQTPQHRHFFIIPWRGHALIGTTDELYRGDPSDFRVTRKDIADFLAEINATYPSAALQMSDVLYFYGGLRPLVAMEDTAADSYNASRKYEILDHKGDTGISGFYTVLGGKYTTSRHLAESLVDMVADKLERPDLACKTENLLLPSSPKISQAAFIESQINQNPNIAPEVIRQLCDNYGTRTPDVIALADNRKQWLEPLDGKTFVIPAQIAYGVKREMACRLADMVFRRTGLGTLGQPSAGTLQQCADLMGDLLGWGDTEKSDQIDLVKQHYEPA